MGVIRHKIWKDLWANKARTLQVVLIIGVGAFALGMIITTRNLVVQAMETTWLASSPAMIGLYTAPAIDDDTIISLTHINGVKAIEGYGVGSVEWRLSADDEWETGIVAFRADYENQKFSKITRSKGAWPEGDFIGVGQGTDTVFGAGLGHEVTIKYDKREQVYTVSGLLHDPVGQPPSFGGGAQFFVDRDTFEKIFDYRDYDRLFASANQYDEGQVTVIANRIRDKLEKQNVETGGFLPPRGNRVVDPTKHFFQDTIDAIFMMLGIMAVLALFLGLFLVYNTINAIISQQVDQIGVMKAIGASSWQILTIYLIYILALGLMALLLALPLGILGGWALNVFLLTSFNADPGPFSVSPPAIWAMVIIAMGAPLLVALIPITSGSRITVREAINTYGLSIKPSFLDRLIARLKRISRLLLLTVSNTFRNKGRVVLTQISLVLSGLIFMMVMSVGDSTNYTFNTLLFSILNYNVNLLFPNPERISKMEAMADNYPGVAKAEMWAFGNGSGRPIIQEASDDDPLVTIIGVVPETTLYGYQMRGGRWLAPGDDHAVVLNQKLAAEMDAGVGDWVTLDQGVTGESDWLVIGLLFDPLLSNTALVPRQVLLREQNLVGRTNSIWIQTTEETPQFEERMAKALRALFESNGIDVFPGGAINNQDTSSEVVAGINAQFRSIVALLATMAVLIGIVGSISLSGVLSLGVIERQREIGVMRAIGASSWDIARIFIGEGLILGWLSWLIAFPLSVPAGQLMTKALSAALGVEIVFHYTPQGAIIWLGVITVLAALASGLPARRATRISVRESLAYQ